jgi:hypothetical protein
MKLKLGHSVITQTTERKAPPPKGYRPGKWVYLGVILATVLWLFSVQLRSWLVLEETGIVVFDVMEERVGEAGELTFVAQSGTHVNKGDVLFLAQPQPDNDDAPEREPPALSAARAELAGVQARLAALKAEAALAAQVELAAWRQSGQAYGELQAKAAGLRAEIRALTPMVKPTPVSMAHVYRADVSGVVVVAHRKAGEYVRPGDAVVRVELDQRPRFEVLIRPSQYARVVQLVGPAAPSIPVILPDGRCVPARIIRFGTSAWDEEALRLKRHAEGAAPYLAVLEPTRDEDLAGFGRMPAKIRIGRHQPTCDSWW